MRILYCISSMEGGGAERQLTYLSRQLRNDGCDVHVALTREGVYSDRLRATEVAVHQLGPCRTHDPRLLQRLIRTIAIVKPDIVQCWLLQMEVMGGLACLASRTPWLFSERSSAMAYGATLKSALRVRMATLADGIVANSGAGAQYWSARTGERVPIYVVPNGVPIDEIDAVPALAVGSSAKEDVTIAYAGRFDAGKNAIGLIRALARVRSVVPVRALLMGQGPLRPEADRLVAALGLGARVRIADFEPNLWSVLKSASMLVTLSRFEGSPNIVLEAMACGCPLVVSDIPAHRELLDERSAIFVDPDDTDAVARTIERVIAEPEAARQRAEAARVCAERHALTVVARQSLAVYETVLSRTRTQKRMAS